MWIGAAVMTAGWLVIGSAFAIMIKTLTEVDNG